MHEIVLFHLAVQIDYELGDLRCHLCAWVINTRS